MPAAPSPPSSPNEPPTPQSAEGGFGHQPGKGGHLWRSFCSNSSVCAQRVLNTSPFHHSCPTRAAGAGDSGGLSLWGMLRGQLVTSEEGML